jgi:hypothetical protein
MKGSTEVSSSLNRTYQTKVKGTAVTNPLAYFGSELNTFLNGIIVLVLAGLHDTQYNDI